MVTSAASVVAGAALVGAAVVGASVVGAAVVGASVEAGAEVVASVLDDDELSLQATSPPSASTATTGRVKRFFIALSLSHR